MTNEKQAIIPRPMRGKLTTMINEKQANYDTMTNERQADEHAAGDTAMPVWSFHCRQSLKVIVKVIDGHDSQQ